MTIQAVVEFILTTKKNVTMSKKTEAVDQNKVDQQEKKQNPSTDQQFTEQAPRDVALDCKVDRVQFAPVDNLEKLAKSGFCCERLNCPDIASELFRLCCEITVDEVEDLPQPVTPFMTAEQLADVIQGAMLLHPMIVKVVQSRHPDGKEVVENDDKN